MQDKPGIRIGIIGAMEVELRLIRNALQEPRRQQQRPHDIWHGRIGAREVVLAHSDVGKVNAAVAAQILIDRHAVDLILNIGSSGAISPELDIGDIVVATDAVQRDVDLSGFGLKRGEVMFDAHVAEQTGQLQCRRQASFPTDLRLREQVLSVTRFAKLQPVAGRQPQIHTGRVLSGDAFLNNAAEGQRLWQEFGALCVDMEAAAIAHVCALNDVPMLIIRAISDRADGTSTTDFPTFLAAATQNYARIAEDFIALL